MALLASVPLAACGAGPPRAEAPPGRAARHLPLTIGGFHGTTSTVSWDGTELRWPSQSPPGAGDTGRRTPRAAEWAGLWRVPTDVRVRDWEENDPNPRVADGSQWLLELSEDGRSVRSEGSNADPLDGRRSRVDPPGVPAVPGGARGDRARLPG